MIQGILTLLLFLSVTCDPPKDFNALDRIFSINQVNGNTDTYSSKIDEDLFEGDIVMNKRLRSKIGELEARGEMGISKFDAIRDGAWPKGVVPYTFATGFSSSYKTVVEKAIAEYDAKTCIRFKPYTTALEKQAGGYIEFIHGGGCYSMIGKQGRKQQISLGKGCGVKGVAIHEMMHALGFFHEQSRRDRDSYITINWDSINKDMYYNFKKYQPGDASTLGEVYDKKSVMHYGAYAFSIDGKPTIISKSDRNERLGQRDGLSEIDIRQLNTYYKCKSTGGDGKTVTKPTTSTTTTTKSTRVVTSTCKDEKMFCSAISSFCSTSSYVKRICKKTCGICYNPVKPVCLDGNRNCKFWAGKSYCRSRTYGSFMFKTCKKSCRIC